MTQLLVKTIADFTTTLTTATAVSATTGTLTSGLDADGVQLPTATYGFTIDRNNAQKEHFTATLTGAALTNIKHVTVGTGVGTSGFTKSHRKGAEVIISDHVSIKRMMDVLDGTTGFDSATPLGYDGAPTFTTGNQVITKTYADSVMAGSVGTATEAVYGTTKLSVAPASAGVPISVGDNDGRVPTQSENDALAGTSGTPSSTNKFVTNDDTTGTGAVVRSSVTDAINLNIYGDGSDGSYTLDGTQAAVAGLFSKSSNTYTLLRDAHFVNLTVDPTITLESANYRIFHTGTLTNNGIVHVNGGNGGAGSGSGAGGTAGSAYSAGSLSAGKAGKTGANGGSTATAGTNGEASGARSLGVAGANGGSSNGAGGGTGGVLTSSAVTFPRTIFNASLMVDFTDFVTYKTGGGAASGGGGYGGDADSGAGGGGGGGGGIIVIFGKILAGNGVFSSTGGNGGAGGSAYRAGGGGGGGQGGVMVFVYNSKTYTGTFVLTAGAAGAVGGGNGGSAGAAGTAGVKYEIDL